MEQEFLSNGLSAFTEENYQTALSYFSKALEKNEANETALLYKACTHNKLGEYDFALKDLQQIKTETFETLYQQALEHLNSKKFEEARNDLQKAKELTSLTDDE